MCKKRMEIWNTRYISILTHAHQGPRDKKKTRPSHTAGNRWRLRWSHLLVHWWSLQPNGHQGQHTYGSPRTPSNRVPAPQQKNWFCFWVLGGKLESSQKMPLHAACASHQNSRSVDKTWVSNSIRLKYGNMSHHLAQEKRSFKSSQEVSCWSAPAETLPCLSSSVLQMAWKWLLHRQDHEGWCWSLPRCRSHSSMHPRLHDLDSGYIWLDSFSWSLKINA